MVTDSRLPGLLFLTAVLMPLSLLHAAVSGITFPLAYKVDEALARQAGWNRGARFRFRSHPGEKLSAEPVYFSKNPRYVALTLGMGDDRLFTAVLDESRGTGSGYDTLYIDANNNEDLTDDGGVSALSDGRSKTRGFPVIQLQVPYGDRIHPYHAKTSVANGFLLKSAGYCTGKLYSADATVQAAIFDISGDGLYNTACSISGRRTSSESLQITGDVMAVMEKNEDIFKAPVLYYTGATLCIDSTCYSATPAPHGRNVVLTRMPGRCGRLTVHARHLSAFLECGRTMIEIRGAGEVRLPPGTYRFKTCSFQKKDTKGLAWRIRDRKQFKTPVVIREGKKSVLRFGPPLTAEIIITRRLSNEFKLDLLIQGRGGGIYSGRDIQAVDAGSTLPAPEFRILDAKKKVIASGRFKYG